MQRRDDDGVETAAIAALVPLEGRRVLEAGCGKGRLTVLAADRASSVYAFDPEEHVVERFAGAGVPEEKITFETPRTQARATTPLPFPQPSCASRSPCELGVTVSTPS